MPSHAHSLPDHRAPRRTSSWHLTWVAYFLVFVRPWTLFSWWATDGGPHAWQRSTRQLCRTSRGCRLATRESPWGYGWESRLSTSELLYTLAMCSSLLVKMCVGVIVYWARAEGNKLKCCEELSFEMLGDPVVDVWSWKGAASWPAPPAEWKSH